MDEIKSVLPKPRIHIDAFGDITPITGNARFVTGDFYDADQMREAIERAVREAMPVQAKPNYWINRSLNNGTELTACFATEEEANAARMEFRWPEEYETIAVCLDTPSQPARQEQAMVARNLGCENGICEQSDSDHDPKCDFAKPRKIMIGNEEITQEEYAEFKAWCAKEDAAKAQPDQPSQEVEK